MRIVKKDRKQYSGMPLVTQRLLVTIKAIPTNKHVTVSLYLGALSLFRSRVIWSSFIILYKND